MALVAMLRTHRVTNISLSRAKLMHNNIALTTNTRPTTAELLKTSEKNTVKRKQNNIERLVGYPSPLLSLRHLIGSELKQLPSLAQRLLSSRHPIIQQSKQFLESTGTLQSIGVLTLLISKSVNMTNSTLPDLDQFGVSSNQRVLAEITEMINMAYMIHSEVVDLDTVQEDTVQVDTERVKELEFGNKLLIIGGDILLAKACKELALLYNPQVVSLISQAISDMMTGAYLKVPAKSSSLTNSTHTEKDTLINSFKPDSTLSIHSDPAMSISPDPFTSLDPQSLYNSYYHIGSLLSNGCRCSAIISELDKDSQTLVAYIGRQLSIALKSSNDLIKLKKSRKGHNVGGSACYKIASDASVNAINGLKRLPNGKPKDALIEFVSNIQTDL